MQCYAIIKCMNIISLAKLTDAHKLRYVQHSGKFIQAHGKLQMSLRVNFEEGSGFLIFILFLISLQSRENTTYINAKSNKKCINALLPFCARGPGGLRGR